MDLDISHLFEGCSAAFFRLFIITAARPCSITQSLTMLRAKPSSKGVAGSEMGLMSSSCAFCWQALCEQDYPAE